MAGEHKASAGPAAGRAAAHPHEEDPAGGAVLGQEILHLVLVWGFLGGRHIGNVIAGGGAAQVVFCRCALNGERQGWYNQNNTIK